MFKKRTRKLVVNNTLVKNEGFKQASQPAFWPDLSPLPVVVCEKCTRLARGWAGSNYTMLPLNSLSCLP